MKNTIRSLSVLLIPIIFVSLIGGSTANADIGAPFNGWLALNGALAKIPYQPEINIGKENGSFTIEGWVNNPYLAPGNDVIVKYSSFELTFWDNSGGWPPPSNALYYMSVTAYEGGIGYVGPIITLATCRFFTCAPTGWFHFAYVYDQSAGTASIFWNGTMVSQTTDFVIPPASTQDIELHYATALDELRISNNVRYTGSFTPQTEPFTCDANTLALWHFDEIEGSTTFHDSCGTEDDAITGYNGAQSMGVKLVSPTKVTIAGPLAGAIGASLNFSATVDPNYATLPITYTWSPVPATGQGTASVTYSWLTDGDKSISVTAENAGGSVIGTHTITLNTPVSGVFINGPSTGVLNKTYQFTAVANPTSATLPINYTWSPLPASGQGTATVTFIWATTGTQKISVKADNANGNASNTNEINIAKFNFVYLPVTLH